MDSRFVFLLRLCLVLCVLAPTLVHAATLGIPGNGAKLSGVSVISGWKCEVEGDLTIVFNDDGKHIPLLYGTERPDVRANGQCLDNDHDNVGFVAIWNWGNLGDGEHTAVAYDDGVPFAESTFTVTTPGTDFLKGASKQITVDDFPNPGDTTVLEWNESIQGFVLAKIIESTPEYEPYAPLLSQVSLTGPLFVTAREGVEILALEEAGNMLSVMLDERPDLSEILRSAGALTAVFSRDQNPCDLPYFNDLSGRPCQSPGGLGGVPGRPATACSEKNLLGLPGDEFFRGTPEGETPASINLPIR